MQDFVIPTPPHSSDYNHSSYQPPEYPHMMLLRKIFKSPYALLCFSGLSERRKKYLLKRWRDDRTRYIFECLRDFDYMSDEELIDLLGSVKIAKALTFAQCKMQIPICLRER